MTLLELRKRNGFTRKELANLTNTSETYILMLEKQKRNPSDKMKIKLAKALNVTPTYIFKCLQENQ